MPSAVVRRIGTPHQHITTTMLLAVQWVLGLFHWRMARILLLMTVPFQTVHAFAVVGPARYDSFHSSSSLLARPSSAVVTTAGTTITIRHQQQLRGWSSGETQLLPRRSTAAALQQSSLSTDDDTTTRKQSIGCCFPWSRAIKNSRKNAKFRRA